MPKIAATALAVPPHIVTQGDARQFAGRYFSDDMEQSRLDRLLAVFDNAGIEKRHVCMPVSWFHQPRSFAEKNSEYIQWARKLGKQVVEDLLEQSALARSSITNLIFVSTTGLSTPSIDARLINDCGLPCNIRRMPLWGLGCAGGAAGLAHAATVASSDPQAVVVLVVVELCSLTFHFGDKSPSNLVATALFADGAAGAIVCGDDIPVQGIEIVATQSTLWPDSLDVMGWNFESEGMQVVFSSRIPEIVRGRVRTETDDFLRKYELSIENVDHLITHPGGPRVLDAYKDSLDLKEEALHISREVLRTNGNMSAATVLFALHRLLQTAGEDLAGWGLLNAVGPGFSIEQVLLRF